MRDERLYCPFCDHPLILVVLDDGWRMGCFFCGALINRKKFKRYFRAVKQRNNEM